MKTIPYHNKNFRLFAAFGGAVYILFRNRPLDLCFALSKPMFYYAFVVSIGAAWVMITAIHRVTLSLDEWLDWRRKFSVRLMAQICLGIMAPAFLDIMLFTGYFWVVGKDILSTSFLTSDLWIVIRLLTLLNFYYYIHYLVLTRKDRQQNFNTESTSKGILNIDHNGMHLYLHVKTDVLAIYRDNRVTKVLTIHGNEYTTTHSLTQLGSDYAKEGLCHINPSFLVNVYMLKGYTNIDRRDIYHPIIKPAFQSAFPPSLADEFIVTKNYLDNFRKRLDEM